MPPLSPRAIPVLVVPLLVTASLVGGTGCEGLFLDLETVEYNQPQPDENPNESTPNENSEDDENDEDEDCEAPPGTYEVSIEDRDGCGPEDDDEHTPEPVTIEENGPLQECGSHSLTIGREMTFGNHDCLLEIVVPLRTDEQGIANTEATIEIECPEDATGQFGCSGQLELRFERQK